MKKTSKKKNKGSDEIFSELLAEYKAKKMYDRMRKITQERAKKTI